VVYIAAGLFKNTHLENLSLDGNRFGRVGLEHLLCPLSTFSPLQKKSNTTLKVLSFGGERANISKYGVTAVLQMLKTNHSLAICNAASMKPNDIFKIFTSLERNATLRSLSLRGCKGVEGEIVLQTIMGTLEVNPWIEEIDLHETPLHLAGKTDQIYEKLCQNGNLVLRSDLLDLPLTAPTCCRVFLCGQELAGTISIILYGPLLYCSLAVLKLLNHLVYVDRHIFLNLDIASCLIESCKNLDFPGILITFACNICLLN
jgi:hypothetical protein